MSIRDNPESLESATLGYWENILETMESYGLDGTVVTVDDLDILLGMAAEKSHYAGIFRWLGNLVCENATLKGQPRTVPIDGKALRIIVSEVFDSSATVTELFPEAQPHIVQTMDITRIPSPRTAITLYTQGA